MKGTGGTNTGIALDDTTQSFAINEAVDKNDPIEFVVYNHDDTEDHTVSAIVFVSPQSTYTGP